MTEDGIKKSLLRDEDPASGSKISINLNDDDDNDSEGIESEDSQEEPSVQI